MVSVTDLTDSEWCERGLWLKKVAGIRTPRNSSMKMGQRFHTIVHDIVTQVETALRAEEIPGRIIETELTLTSDELIGRIDVLRCIAEENCYIIQDEKYSDPPKEGRVHPNHKLQLDAYAYLAEKNGYTPIKSAVILYNDLRPREVKPEPEKIPLYIEKIHKIIMGTVLPQIQDEKKCQYCSYFTLCQTLPFEGGLTKDQIWAFKKSPIKVVHQVKDHS